MGNVSVPPCIAARGRGWTCAANTGIGFASRHFDRRAIDDNKVAKGGERRRREDDDEVEAVAAKRARGNSSASRWSKSEERPPKMEGGTRSSGTSVGSNPEVWQLLQRGGSAEEADGQDELDDDDSDADVNMTFSEESKRNDGDPGHSMEDVTPGADSVAAAQAGNSEDDDMGEGSEERKVEEKHLHSDDDSVPQEEGSDSNSEPVPDHIPDTELRALNDPLVLLTFARRKGRLSTAYVKMLCDEVDYILDQELHASEVLLAAQYRVATILHDMHKMQMAVAARVDKMTTLKQWAYGCKADVDAVSSMSDQMFEDTVGALTEAELGTDT
ncbi:predicted protein [Postia placenta Mad-698-R]|nr:predicted protein [Postia placenta Mad-698-R]